LHKRSFFLVERRILNSYGYPRGRCVFFEIKENQYGA